jgi:N-acetyl-gamma-glutamyl-phosphate reductase
MSDKINIAIAGATGFVGLEIIKKISNHPNVNIKYLFVKESINQDIYKSLPKTIKNLPELKKLDINLINECDVFFPALPHAELHKLAKEISNDVVVIDLSADFRLPDISTYEKWYKIKHESPELQKKAVYGLSEVYRNQIKSSNLIACPGCYPTSVLIPLHPLVSKNLIENHSIIIDSKSGYSGAGKKIYNNDQYPNLDENIAIYGVGQHRHMPEIDYYLSQFSNNKIEVSFTPHLIPTFRGMLSTIYIKSQNSLDDLFGAINEQYKSEPFVEVLKSQMINTDKVTDTNKTLIAIHKSNIKNSFIISCSIDNLLKGAAGQAIQNFNIRFGFEETLGLD